MSTDLSFEEGVDPALFARSQLGLEPDVKQTELLCMESRRVLVNCTRQWGKSTVTAVKAVHEAISTEGSLTIVASPSARQSGEFLRKASEFARRLGIKAHGDGDNEISLAFPNGSRIVGLPGNEATVRGFSAVSLLVIDEAARVGEDLYKAVRPMLAVGRGSLWLLSTPHGKRGFFYEAWEHGGRQWLRIRVPATECRRISREFLEEERVALGDMWFRQEYLCEFLENEENLFRRDVIEAAITWEVEPLKL
jgi:Terminase large subunit, T4likevirus-type, N-terminal